MLTKLHFVMACPAEFGNFSAGVIIGAEFFGIMYKRARPVGKLVLKEIAHQDGTTSFSALLEKLKKTERVCFSSHFRAY